MKLIKPSYKILSSIDGSEILKNIEISGRTCYKSEENITNDSAEKFIKMLINRGHESVLEHQSFSVRFVCDRGVSHELVRHRLASFSQESTRYCNYSKDKFDNQLTFIIPEWLLIPEGTYNSSYIITGESIKGEATWFTSMLEAEATYNCLIVKSWRPEQARSILPNSLKTEIVITANLREWRLIFKQRTAKVAHPQMRELMCPLLNELQTIIPVIFDDLKTI